LGVNVGVRLEAFDLHAAVTVPGHRARLAQRMPYVLSGPADERSPLGDR
jgi:hypothetical protein